MKMSKRKSIPAKIRLEVFKRDRYTCQLCGKSPAKYPEVDLDVVELEIDHYQPVSKDGDNSLANLQTLCRQCNRGKGNDESFNITIEQKLENLLNRINPQILHDLQSVNRVHVVANEIDFQELIRLLNMSEKFKVEVIPNTLIGYKAGFSLGIYTIEDHGDTPLEVKKIFQYDEKSGA